MTSAEVYRCLHSDQASQPLPEALPPRYVVSRLHSGQKTAADECWEWASSHQGSGRPPATAGLKACLLSPQEALWAAEAPSGDTEAPLPED